MSVYVEGKQKVGRKGPVQVWHPELSFVSVRASQPLDPVSSSVSHTLPSLPAILLCSWENSAVSPLVVPCASPLKL